MAKCSGSGEAKLRIKELDWNMRETLEELQGSIYFEKKLSATNARHCSTESNRRRYGQLSIPTWFVQAHGDKFERNVTLRMGSSTKPWSHRLSFCSSRDVPENTQTMKKLSHQVTFAGSRWSAFVAFHALVAGDQLVFSLTAMSQFQVYLFDAHGQAKAPQPLHRPVMVQRPQRYYEDEDKSCQYSKATTNSLTEEEFLLDVPCLPSFTQRLAASNVSSLEIPKDFAETYSTLLEGRCIQLQGIHEGSPVLGDVQCVRYMDQRRVPGRTRLYLTSGWDDFVCSNALRVDQVLVFTLVADSCFTVREEISWCPATGFLPGHGSQALLSEMLI